MSARLDLREIEHLVDDVQQMLGAVLDVAHVFFVAVVVERTEHFAAYDFGEADDRVQRCADFVRHVGQKRALGAAAGVGVFLGLAQRFFGFLEFGNFDAGVNGHSGGRVVADGLGDDQENVVASGRGR